MTNADVHDGHLSVDSPLGKIKGIPISALSWIVMAAGFLWMLYQLTTGISTSMQKIAEEQPKQTILLEKIYEVHIPRP